MKTFDEMPLRTYQDIEANTNPLRKVHVAAAVTAIIRILS